MLRCLAASTVFACVTLTSLPASAQSEPSRIGRNADLSGVCAASLERFCPALANGPPQLRNQVICLRPYRSSIPLACRKAVTAAIR